MPRKIIKRQFLKVSSKHYWKSATFITCIDINKRACTLKMSVFKIFKSPRDMSFDTGSD